VERTSRISRIFRDTLPIRYTGDSNSDVGVSIDDRNLPEMARSSRDAIGALISKAAKIADVVECAP
jgi:hypothetical protein